MKSLLSMTFNPTITRSILIRSACAIGLAVFCALAIAVPAAAQGSFIEEEQISAAIDALVAEHGPSQQQRMERGVRQVAQLWREKDGTADQFGQFCRDSYIADPELLQKTADRFEAAFESIFGHFREMGRDLYWHLSVETGPILPIDHLFARYSPGAHAIEDMFKNKIAFYGLLNYPLCSLDERLVRGPLWTRDEWAQARLVERFAARVPPEVSQRVGEVWVAADSYISDYNIYMHHLLTPDGRRPFREGLKLISHWNLRDELKSLYAEPDGLPKQEMIYHVMQQIIRQEIPAAVVGNPSVDWKLSTNEVTISPIVDGDLRPGWDSKAAAGETVDNSREPDTRYQHLLALFQAQREVDPYYPTMPTLIDRRFERDREMSEQEVEQILRSVLSAPVIADIGRLVEKRLGRKLRPFDIWYNGFTARGSFTEDELNRIVREKYPTAAAFQADLANILIKLGFDDSTSQFVVSRIEVDPSRGAGHASAPGRRADKARLRTRVAPTGMDYKGYNIAVHEFGHNVEQVLSLNRVDHTLLRGVPSTAFTEGFAFVFQSRDLELLGLAQEDESSRHLKALDEMWGAFEIAGVALVDMKVWNWMYDHPDATPAELKEGVISSATEVWNKFFAPVFGMKDIDLLCIYSHMIDGALYLPHYPLGSIIAFQVEEYLSTRSLAVEMERMCKLGSITPGLWMNQAVGAPISVQPMVLAARQALGALAE